MYRFALIGYPVSHSLSPKLFEAAYAGKYGYDLIGEEDFERAWNAFAQGPYLAVNVTAPFKEKAFEKVMALNPELVPGYVREIGACNILLKTDRGIEAHNSDYLGIRRYLSQTAPSSVVVVGFGGAGKAALAAARSLGLPTELRRHDEVSRGITADVVIYTLPKYVDGADRINCRILFEANYRDPSLGGRPGYVSGLEWLLLQALEGYTIMTGEKPDTKSLKKVCDVFAES